MALHMRITKQRGLTAAVIGKDGRTTAITRLLERSPKVSGPVQNLASGASLQPAAYIDEVLQNARRIRPDFVVIGPEGPLALGIVDQLEAIGVPSVGPVRALADLEASKAFTRNLLARQHIPGNPEHRVFTSPAGVGEYLRSLGDFVIKPDGLTGGKGVKVSGDHLSSVDEGVAYCDTLFRRGDRQVVIEEKLDGEEFSLQSFCDGSHVVHTVAVQDHKRAYEGDRGPNTGGMGSYSDANYLLPFLDRASVEDAKAITERVVKALLNDTGQKYKGILFGGFMLTKGGVRLLEYNARFGDPESLNVLCLLDADLADICVGIVNETLNEVPVTFRPLATVCKYVVPEGYPEHPVKGESIDLSAIAESDQLKIFHAAVDARPDGRLTMTGSRAVAFVGLGQNLADAERHAERAASAVRGRVFHRRDIGSAELIQKRVTHMNQVRQSVATRAGPASAPG